MQFFLTILGLVFAVVDLFGLSKKLEELVANFVEQHGVFDAKKHLRSRFREFVETFNTARMAAFGVLLGALLLLVLVFLPGLFEVIGVIFGAEPSGFAVGVGFFFSVLILTAVSLVGLIIDVLTFFTGVFLRMAAVPLARIAKLLGRPKKGFLASTGVCMMVLGFFV